jgi:hypothetical protein
MRRVNVSASEGEQLAAVSRSRSLRTRSMSHKDLSHASSRSFKHGYVEGVTRDYAGNGTTTRCSQILTVAIDEVITQFPHMDFASLTPLRDLPLLRWWSQERPTCEAVSCRGNPRFAFSTAAVRPLHQKVSASLIERF